METSKMLKIIDRIENYYNKRFTENGYGFTVNLELFSDESGAIKLFSVVEDYKLKTGLRFDDNETELFSFTNFEEFIDNFIDWVIQNVGV